MTVGLQDLDNSRRTFYMELRQKQDPMSENFFVYFARVGSSFKILNSMSHSPPHDIILLDYLAMDEGV